MKGLSVQVNKERAVFTLEVFPPKSILYLLNHSTSFAWTSSLAWQVSSSPRNVSLDLRLAAIGTMGPKQFLTRNVIADIRGSE